MGEPLKAQGWIKLHRRLQLHWLWEEKRVFSRAEAWIDLLMMANHQDTRFVLGNELISAQRGEVITSELKLMARWGWSKAKVRAFLKLLENDSMIAKKTDRKKTALIIVNWALYQVEETAKEPQKNHEETAKRPQKDTIKNEKNEEEGQEALYICPSSENTHSPSLFDTKSQDELFNIFWNEYPRKEAKKEAHKAWFKIQPNEMLFNKIIDGLKRAKRSAGWNKGKQFIPLPATWLNGERWEDQLDCGEVTDNNISKYLEPYDGSRD